MRRRRVASFTLARLIAEAARPRATLDLRDHALATARARPASDRADRRDRLREEHRQRHARGARRARRRRRQDRALGLPAGQRGLPARSSRRSAPASSPPTARSIAPRLGARRLRRSGGARARLNAIVHPLIGAELGGAHRGRARRRLRGPDRRRGGDPHRGGLAGARRPLWVVSVDARDGHRARRRRRAASRAPTSSGGSTRSSRMRSAGARPTW